jgi:hypothetical protein
MKRGWSGSSSAGSALLEALPTKDWPALGGLEGDGGLLPAPGTVGPGLYFGVVSRRCSSHGGGPLGFAGFATFRFVLELLVVEEQLFSRCKNEVGAAVNTL